MGSTKTISLVLMGLLALGCSDDEKGGTRDGGVIGDKGTGTGTEAGLWKCQTPGKSCNAHNACAINPVCGKDFLCRATTWQDCSDKLDCTEDRCTGLGMCENKPKAGWCALMVPDPKGGDSVRTCLKPGMPGATHPKDPCKACDPTQSLTKWSAASGKKCDDQSACTINDVCKAGVCAGTYYGNKCGDGKGCTDDKCDGKGGCSNPMKSGNCLIGGKCYKDKVYDSNGCGFCDSTKSLWAWTPTPDICKIGLYCFTKGTKDASGCGVCDPKKDAKGWSPSTDKCLIGGVCYAKGDKHSSKCATCDPAKSQSAWTPDSGKCWISGKCYASGVKDKTGCGSCNTAASSLSWTPVSGATIKASTFETGLNSFTVSAAVKGVGWQQSASRAHGGSKGSLHYGSKSAGGYDTGAINKGTAKSPAYTLASGKKAVLYFWVYMDTETTDKFDMLSATVQGTVVWKKDSTTMPAANYRRWVPIEVDLSSFAGKTVNITFSFDTGDAWANSSEGVYIDDVKVVSGC